MTTASERWLRGEGVVPSDTIRESLARMEDHELLQRWRESHFSDEAKPIALEEIRVRNLDPLAPTPRDMTSRIDPLPRLFPRLVWGLVAILLAVAAGRVIGPVVVDSLGTLASVIMFGVVGWYLDGIVVRVVRGRVHPIFRMLVYLALLVLWSQFHGDSPVTAPSSGVTITL